MKPSPILRRLITRLITWLKLKRPPQIKPRFPEHGDCGEDSGEQVNETQSTLKAGNKFPSLEKDPVLDLVPKWKEKMRLPGKVKRLQVKKHFQGRKLMIPAQMPRCSGHRNRNAQT